MWVWLIREFLDIYHSIRVVACSWVRLIGHITRYMSKAEERWGAPPCVYHWNWLMASSLLTTPPPVGERWTCWNLTLGALLRQHIGLARPAAGLTIPAPLLYTHLPVWLLDTDFIILFFVNVVDALASGPMCIYIYIPVSDTYTNDVINGEVNKSVLLQLNIVHIQTPSFMVPTDRVSYWSQYILISLPRLGPAHRERVQDMIQDLSWGQY